MRRNIAMAHRPEIETFRSRLKQPKKATTNWQQWIGSPTAWLALILSASSFFYTFLYYSDDLSVVMDRPVIQPAFQDVLRISAPRNMTFINSGSRPIVITGAQLILVHGWRHFADCRK